MQDILEEEFRGKLNLKLWLSIMAHAWRYKANVIVLACQAVACAVGDSAFGLLTMTVIDEAHAHGASPRLLVWGIAYRAFDLYRPHRLGSYLSEWTDIAKASTILPLWRGYSITDEALAARATMVGERQIGRLFVVGSNPETGPVIEASYKRFLAAFEAHLSSSAFVLGGRPSSCDFALFGQLTQLALFDPTPSALTLVTAPRVYAWVGLMEDLSGFEPPDEGWVSMDALPKTLTALLAEIGRVYPPVMLANARAVASGAHEVQAVVDGRPWRQPPFPYQAKCLQWLREGYAALPPASRRKVDPVLEASGCAAVVALVA
jgi:hypothetical protein